METQRNNQNVQNDSFLDELKDSLLLYAGVQGKYDALNNNQPASLDEFQVGILNKTRVEVQTAIDWNQKMYLPISGVVVAKSILKETEQEIKILEAPLPEKERKLRPLLNRAKQIVPDAKQQLIRKTILWGLAVVAVTEGFFAYDALRQAFLPRVTSVISSVGIAFAIAFGLHVSAQYINNARNKKWKNFRYLLSLIPPLIVFYFIGDLRAQEYNEHFDLSTSSSDVKVNSNGEVSGLAITAISFILYLVALVISVKNHKTKEESKQEKEYEQLSKEINSIEYEMKLIKNKSIRLKDEAKVKAEIAYRNFEIALANEKRLIRIADLALIEYAAQNKLYRSDGLCPWFLSTPPKIQFKLFLHNSETKTDENTNSPMGNSALHGR